MRAKAINTFSFQFYVEHQECNDISSLHSHTYSILPEW